MDCLRSGVQFIVEGSGGLGVRGSEVDTLRVFPARKIERGGLLIHGSFGV